MISILLAVACLGPVESSWTIDRPLADIAGCLQQHAMSAAAHLPPGLLTAQGAEDLGRLVPRLRADYRPGEHYFWFRADFQTDVKVGRRLHAVTGYTTGEAWGQGPRTVFRLTTEAECDERGVIPRLIDVFGPGKILMYERDQIDQLTN